MEDEVAKEPSTSDRSSNFRFSRLSRKIGRKFNHLFASFGNLFRKLSRRPPTLHVVCSPGGGAFSVYMFIRYALAQREHFKAQVEMTMLCRVEKDGTIEAEKWWGRWAADQSLKIPKGWTPRFLTKEMDDSLKTPPHCSNEIFMLAGGEQAWLIEEYRYSKDKKGDSQQVVLVNEEDIVQYSEGQFTFRSAFNNNIDLLPNDHNLNPQESLVAVEKAHNAKLDELLKSHRKVGPIKPKNHKKNRQNQGTFKVHWEKDIQFIEHEPTRLIVNVRPKFTDVKVANSYTYEDMLKVKLLAVKSFVKDFIEEWFDWRKSLRFKLEEEFEENLELNFFTRRPDARKLFMYNPDKESSRGKRYSANSILFNHPKESLENKSVARSLFLMAWDTKNIGRSTQLLSQRLETLEKNQSLLLLQFSDENDEKRTAQSSLIIQSLNHQDEVLRMYNEDLEKLETRHISTTECLKNERYSSFSLITIGMNGPSLKTIIDSIDPSKDLQIFGERDIENQSKKVNPLSVHRSFIRGIFPTKWLGARYSKMEDFENQWLINAGQISYITWLSENARMLERKSYLPNRFLCTMDSFGRVLHIFDVKQNEALEVLLYIALFKYEKTAKGRFFTSSPNPDGFENKTMFKTYGKRHSDIGNVQFPNEGATQNAEIWFTELKDGAFRHYVGDAKAIFHESKSDALDRADEAFTNLLSKYNWKTLHGDIRVVMLSLLGGSDESFANDNPFIFSKQSYFGLKEKPKRALEELYSIEVSRFAEYIKSFMREYQPDITPISFQEYRSNDAEGHSNFEAKLPFHQSESIPKKNQTSLHFFRKKPPSDADKKNIHSGFFFDPNTYDFQEAFYFHNKSLFAVGEYFLTSQGKDDHDSRERLNHVSDLQELIDFIDAILSPTKKSKNVFFDPFAPRETTKTSGGQFELSEDDTKLLTRLEQITNEMQIKSPEQQNRDYLSKWAEDVLYHLYQKADESMTYDSENPPNLPLNNKINEIFMAAAESAKNQHPQSMNKFNDFIRGLRSFSNSFSVQAPKRYDWYLRQKSRRSSQSSQSDA